MVQLLNGATPRKAASQPERVSWPNRLTVRRMTQRPVLGAQPSLWEMGHILKMQKHKHSLCSYQKLKNLVDVIMGTVLNF